MKKNIDFIISLRYCYLQYSVRTKRRIFYNEGSFFKFESITVVNVIISEPSNKD